MPQCSGTQFLTRLVEHATLSESGPIRQDNPPETIPWSLIMTPLVKNPLLKRPAIIIDSAMPL